MASLATKVAGQEGAPRLFAGTGKDQVHLLVVANSDKGLAGAFNSNIVRAALAGLRNVLRHVEMLEGDPEPLLPWRSRIRKLTILSRRLGQRARWVVGNKWQSRTFEPRGHSEEKLDASTNSLGRSCCRRFRWRELLPASSRPLALDSTSLDTTGGNHEETDAWVVRVQPSRRIGAVIRGRSMPGQERQVRQMPAGQGKAVPRRKGAFYQVQVARVRG